LIVAAVVGDGESETGPLATSLAHQQVSEPSSRWRCTPHLHLNGYKIDNPTLLARISHEELENLFLGYAGRPISSRGSEIDSMHQAMAATVEHCIEEIREHRRAARSMAMSPGHAGQ
jgi:xylulose-5-phosphate/fructose-6-phosphate phosphoketolase